MPERAVGAPGPVTVFSGGGTGGHLYPALALAEALRALRPEVRPFFVGAERGIEARVLPERGLEHLLLPVMGFRRGRILGHGRAVAALLRAVATVVRTFRSLRPPLVVVTGGYAGGPAGLAAGVLGIRLVLQEQNAVPGVTTRVLSLWAREIHVAFPEAARRLPRLARRRARISGNPVRPPVRKDPGEARRAFGLPPEGRVILVVGGSQGSAALNRAVMGAVRGVEDGTLSRPADLSLLWATGPAHLEGIRGELGEVGHPPWVRSVGYIDEMSAALSAADLAVSRAGAMATSEFLAWGLPALLVPLPTAAADHQSRNAAALEEAGAAVRLPEDRLEPGTLWTRAMEIASDPERLRRMGRAAARRGRPKAATEIAASLASYLPPTREAA